MNIQSKGLTRATPLLLACLLGLPVLTLADEAHPDQGSGQATTEIEQWQAQIAENGRQVAAFQD